jgi:type IV pilus assembly protein PilY1
MSSNLKKFLRYAICGFFVTAILGAGVAQAAHDDTEIFVGRADSSVKPNVMFIIDTSGSMTTQESVGDPYDSSTTYSGSCEPSHIYWSLNHHGTGSVPTCNDHNNDYINVSANTCKAMTDALASSAGFYSGIAAKWAPGWKSSYRWRSLSYGDHDDYVECKDDSGVNGQTAGDAAVYASDSSGPWSTSRSDRISWNRSGDTYSFYSANYVNWYNSPTGGSATMSRLDLIKDITDKLIDSVDGINLGLMRFDAQSGYSSPCGSPNCGGFIESPVVDIATNKTELKNVIDGYTAERNTPLAETMLEAIRYFRGDTPYFGLETTPRHSADSSMTDGHYISPIVDECQKNHTVYFTDGDPTNDSDADSAISSLTGKSCSFSSGNDCLDELAQWAYENDMSSGMNSSVPGVNNIITHTIGFKSTQQLLQDTAEKGGGSYHTADDYKAVQSALTQVITKILSTSAQFTAPAVSVNAFNRLNHLDQVYYALFQPQEGASWHGNIKRYRFDSALNQLVDKDGKPAVNPTTGEFNDNITSYWSDVVDGNDVTLGGAANELTVSRNVYTYTGSADPGNVDLTAAENALNENNTNITRAMLSLPSSTSDTDFQEYLTWARGVDIRDSSGNTPRKEMGDPLHSKPVLVTYGGTEASPDLTLFAMTNEGFFHAIKASDGTETFAFMPPELLKNIPTLADNIAGTKVYGLDGPLAVDVKDVNGNGQIESADGDYVYAYFGMRRGGQNYYALNVTDRSKPKLMWEIKGGTGDFAELGQTWSKPIHTYVKLGGQEKKVLIFAGGYDTNRDDAPTRDDTGYTDTMGRALYIVNASDGTVLWSGGPSATGFTKQFTDMKYSIPSDVTAIDINLDGLVDQIFVGDTGGQLWRFDMNNSASTNTDLVTGGVIADLDAPNATDAANNRHFYYAPDVSLGRDSSGKLAYAIAIGSGWRAHPLDTVVQDRFYVLKNPNVMGPARDASNDPVYTKITESNLYDATDNLVGQENAQAISDLNSAVGWYIKLENTGEKALAKSATINGTVLFTTYDPNNSGSTSGGCTPNVGTGRIYFVNVWDATPVIEQDGSLDALTKADRVKVLASTGIPPSPKTLYLPDGPAIVVGKETINGVNFGDLNKQTFWRDLTD